jgi:hypothetical protein
MESSTNSSPNPLSLRSLLNQQDLGPSPRPSFQSFETNQLPPIQNEFPLTPAHPLTSSVTLPSLSPIDQKYFYPTPRSTQEPLPSIVPKQEHLYFHQVPFFCVLLIRVFGVELSGEITFMEAYT